MMRFCDLALRAVQVATGIMGWPPDQFWTTTPSEMVSAWQGWCLARGIDPTQTPLSATDLLALRMRFPDSGPSMI